MVCSRPMEFTDDADQMSWPKLVLIFISKMLPRPYLFQDIQEEWVLFTFLDVCLGCLGQASICCGLPGVKKCMVIARELDRYFVLRSVGNRKCSYLS